MYKIQLWQELSRTGGIMVCSRAPFPRHLLCSFPALPWQDLGSQRVFQRAECTDYWRAARGIIVIFHGKFSK